jgi:NAD+ synthase
MRAHEVAQFITEWLRRYSEEAKAGGFVIGISGGIDSAVSSTLAARTGLPLLCLEMPIKQNRAHVSRARDHIAFLQADFPKVRALEVDLTPVFDELTKVLPETGDPGRKELALANARARMRMATLYYFSGVHECLVLGTGNKVEDFGIGFFTKYGDGGVDLSPLGDLTKTQVYDLGEELGIIESIMTAAPTDGLWGDDRTDEEQIGATYPELEWAMAFNGDESMLGERQREVLDIYRKLHNANLHKLTPVPVCKIPERMFSTG